MKKLVMNAERALLYEVVTTGKPGLVSLTDTGSHPDMDIYTFINSSLALEPYFSQAELLGRQFSGTVWPDLFNQLRQTGISAERVMLQATHGVNTHKGAIFALGLFVCASSYTQTHGGDCYQIIQAMTQGLLAHDLKNPLAGHTAGEQQFVKYQLGGARQAAEQGYGAVKRAVKFLETCQGSCQERILDTFMFLAGQVPDSTLVKRAGNPEVLVWLAAQVTQFFALGGSRSCKGQDFLMNLNATFKAHHYSLGGCADLLACTLFIALNEGKLA